MLPNARYLSRVLMISGILALPMAVGGGSGTEPQFKAVRAVMPPSPIWLSAARVLTADGKVKTGIFDEGSERSLSRIVSEAGIRAHSSSAYGGPCPSGYMGRNSDRLQQLPNDSLTNLALHAQGVYSGQIVAVLPGFLFGDPGTLLQLRVADALRSSPAIRPSPDLFVFYPFMNTSVAGKILCRADARFPFRPRVGDSALVFVYDAPLDEQGTLVTPKDTEILLQHPGEALYASPTLRSELQLRDLSSINSLESELRSRLGPDKAAPRLPPPVNP